MVHTVGKSNGAHSCSIFDDCLIRSGFKGNGFNSMSHSRLILSDCGCELRPRHA